MNVGNNGLVKKYNYIARSIARISFPSSHTHIQQKMDSLNQSHKTPLTIPDGSFPGWEVLHIYQHGECENTILLLRRTGSTGEPLAVGKILRFSNRYQRSADEIQNEADALANIPPHPGVIQLYSTHVNADGQQSLLLEFCAGEDLKSFLHHARTIRMRMPESFFWHVFHQVLGALEHLDRHQMWHGDLNSGNLFLRPAAVDGDAYPDVVLADFEYAAWKLGDQRSGDKRSGDSVMLGKTLLNEIFSDTDHSRYSQSLRNFVDTVQAGCAGAELADELIPLARTMADADGTRHRIPAWMTAYFATLGGKAVSRPHTPACVEPEKEVGREAGAPEHLP